MLANVFIAGKALNQSHRPTIVTQSVRLDREAGCAAYSLLSHI